MALELKNYDPAVMQGANIGVSVDLTDITDMNGNEVIEIDGITSAVNYVRVSNSATGNRVDISVQGDDSNVGLNLTPKGTGILRFVVATVSSITTGGAFDASGLGGTEPIFIVGTTTRSPVTPVTQATAASTAYITVQLATGTTRFIRVYD